MKKVFILVAMIASTPLITRACDGCSLAYNVYNLGIAWDILTQPNGAYDGLAVAYKYVSDSLADCSQTELNAPDPKMVRNIRGTDDSTPLMLAAQFALVDIVRSLIQKGASVTITDSRGRDALWYAKNSCQSNVPGHCSTIVTLISDAQTSHSSKKNRRTASLKKEKSHKKRSARVSA